MLLIYKIKLRWLWVCRKDELNEWERQFVGTLFFDLQKELSKKQIEVLDKLYHERRNNLYWHHNWHHKRRIPYDREELMGEYAYIHDFDR